MHNTRSPFKYIGFLYFVIEGFENLEEIIYSRPYFCTLLNIKYNFSPKKGETKYMNTLNEWQIKSS